MFCLSVSKTLRFVALVSLVGKCHNNYFNENVNNNSLNLTNINNDYNSSASSLMSDKSAPDLSVYAVTWNVKGEQPKCDLSQLLAIKSTTDGTTNSSLPTADLYVIGLQEVSVRPSIIFFTDPWIEAFDKVFRQLDYVRVKSVRLVGILLLAYTRRQYLPKFRTIETQYSATGFGGYWGNKGGVGLSLIVDGVSLCLVNSHLAPHFENLERRISDYNTIVDDQYFVSTRKPNILSHDYVIWLGDLNFRIDDLTGEQIHDIILNNAQEKSSNFSALLDKDQLNRVRREGRAFSEFTESVPHFAPTYKFFVNTDSYDYRSRKPAFTDRVLYRFTANAYENFELDLKQVEYRSHPQYKQSDHKPVTAIFHIKTKRSFNRLIGKRSAPFSLSDTTDQQLIDATEEIPLSVTFLPITDWKMHHDCTAWYTITPNDDQAIAQLSQWDWIGLFKSDFISLEEHTAFVWANPVPSRWSHPSVQLSDDNTDGQSQSRVRSGEPYFSVQFTDQSLLISDKFRLVYVSQSGDVLGMSDPFLVRH